MTETLVGSKEAAQIAGITTNHFGVMRKRGQVPEPRVVLACGPIWNRSEIERWIDKTNESKRRAA